MIAYAFHELTGVERLNIQQHVRSCHHCLNLVLDLRAAREEAGSDSLPAVDWNTYNPGIQSVNSGFLSAGRHWKSASRFRDRIAR